MQLHQQQQQAEGLGMDKQRARQRGSVSLFFLAFVVVVVAAISFSTFVGGRVHHQIKTDQAADAASKAAALQTAQGMNMIAVNNIGIASALQINNSFLLMAYYAGLLKAMAYSAADVGEDIVAWKRGLGVQIQTSVFDTFNDFGKVFIQAAQGLTTYNRGLRSYWMQLAAVKAVEFGKLNDPGALVLPFHGEGDGAQIAPFAGFTYEASSRKAEQLFFTSRADDALCVVTAARPAGVNPDSMVEWLAGPFATLETAVGGGGLVSQMSEKITGILSKLEEHLPLKMGLIECGIGLKSSLWDFFDAMKPGGVGVSVIYSRYDFRNRLLSQHNELFPTYGNGLCQAEKISAQALLGTELLFGPAFANKYQEPVMRAAMFAQMYQRWQEQRVLAPNTPPPRLPFSTVSWEACKEDEHGSLPADCNDYVSVGPNTWICPFERVVLDHISASCGFNAPPLSHRHYPREEAVTRFDQWCTDYRRWRDAGRNGANPGMQLLSWGRQAQAFSGANLRADEESNLGFLVIRKDHASAFYRRLTNRVLLMSPIWSQSEFSDLAACSDHHYSLLDDKARKRCQIELYRHFTLGFGGRRLARDAAHDKAVSPMMSLSDGGTTSFDGDHSVFMRMQWAMSKYRSTFVLAEKDHLPAIQPHLRSLWPAWSVTPAPVKIGEFFKADDRLSLLDRMLGN